MLFSMVELTGLAPVYQRKPTKLSPYTVCFCCHTTKKANKLAVSRHLRVSVTIGAPAECYLFAKSDADHLASQRSQGPRAGLNYAAYAIPKERLVLLLAFNLGLPCCAVGTAMRLSNLLQRRANLKTPPKVFRLWYYTT